MDAGLRPVVELTQFGLDLAADRRTGLAEKISRFLARPYRLPLAMIDAKLYLARLRYREGDTAEAEAGLREVIAEATRTGAIWPLVPAHTALAELLLARGSTAEGQAEARAALALADAKGLPTWGADAARLAGRVQQR